MKIARLVGAFLVAAVLSGCHFPAEPNPNDPNQLPGDRQAFAVRDYMKQLSDVINNAVFQRKITEEQGVELRTAEAKAYMDSIHFKTIPANEQSIVAQGFITAREWDKAKALLEVAIRVDTNADSIVNDRLKYARCLAGLGDIQGAIKMARSTFDAPPEWKWPILYAVYLEIVPAAVEKDPSARLELAQLVEDAIAQHQQAVGDIKNPVQSAWVVSRAHHIEKAWDLVISLYKAAGRPDLAAAAAAKQSAAPKEPKVLQA